MLRRRWRDLLVLVALYLVVCACLVLPSPGGVQWRGFFVGMCAGVLLAGVAGLLLVLDGSLLRRIGRVVESDLGDELRRVRGVYGVVSSLMFRGCDVDHVVLAPGGVWVVEVKWSMHPAEDLDRVWGLAGHLEQVRVAARKVSGLLRTVAPGVPVHAVLVLAGPGMPQVADGVVREGVRVLAAMSRGGWAELFAAEAVVWDVDAARPAGEALTRLRDARVAYELARS